MNQLNIIGNLTRDPQVRDYDGATCCNFTVAVNRRVRADAHPEADYVRVTAWRGLGDVCAKYLKKGRKVRVTGPVRPYGWTGEDGNPRAALEMTADDVEFCSSSGGSHGPSDEDAPPDRGAAQGQRDPESGYERVDPEDQPF